MHLQQTTVRFYHIARFVDRRRRVSENDPVGAMLRAIFGTKSGLVGVLPVYLKFIRADTD